MYIYIPTQDRRDLSNNFFGTRKCRVVVVAGTDQKPSSTAQRKRTCLRGTHIAIVIIIRINRDDDDGDICARARQVWRVLTPMLTSCPEHV